MLETIEAITGVLLAQTQTRTEVLEFAQGVIGQKLVEWHPPFEGLTGEPAPEMQRRTRLSAQGADKSWQLLGGVLPVSVEHGNKIKTMLKTEAKCRLDAASIAPIDLMEPCVCVPRAPRALCRCRRSRLAYRRCSRYRQTRSHSACRAAMMPMGCG